MTRSDIIYFMNSTHTKQTTELAKSSPLDRYERYTKQKPFIDALLFIYRYVFSFGVVVGFGAFIGMWIFMILLKRYKPIHIFITSLVISMSGLLVLISYIEAIQSPLLTIQYLAPIHCLLYVIGFLSIYECYQLICTFHFKK